MLSIKGIISKFKIPEIVKSVTQFDDRGNVTLDWSEARRRSMRLYVMATQYSSIALYLTLAVSFFFAHDKNYGWSCSRDWLPRPSFDTEAIVEYWEAYSEASVQAGKYMWEHLSYLSIVMLLAIAWYHRVIQCPNV